MSEQEPDLTQEGTVRSNPFQRFLSGIKAAAERIKLDNLTERVTYAPPESPLPDEQYQPQQQIQAHQSMSGYRPGDPVLEAARRLYGNDRE